MGVGDSNILDWLHSGKRVGPPSFTLLYLLSDASDLVNVSDVTLPEIPMKNEILPPSPQPFNLVICLDLSQTSSPLVLEQEHVVIFQRKTAGSFSMSYPVLVYIHVHKQVFHYHYHYHHHYHHYHQSL